jgi:hypothetical protein
MYMYYDWGINAHKIQCNSSAYDWLIKTDSALLSSIVGHVVPTPIMVDLGVLTAVACRVPTSGMWHHVI